MSTSLAAVLGITHLSTGAILLSNLGQHDTSYAVPERKRTTPRSHLKHHFDQLDPEASLLGKQFVLNYDTENASEIVQVQLATPFQWNVNGQNYTIASFTLNESTMKPQEHIPCTGSTMQQCVVDIVPAQNNTGIDIHTSVGFAHVPIDQLKSMIWALAHPTPTKEPKQQTETTVSPNVEIRPNEKGQVLIDGANNVGAVRNLFAYTGLVAPAKKLHVPRNATIDVVFTSDTPPPVIQSEPEYTPVPEQIASRTHVPVTAEQQAAWLRRKRDEISTLLFKNP